MKRGILPIGTVCELVDNRIIMIVGYKNIDVSNNTISINDYIGVPYPEGFSGNGKTSFDEDNIKQILYKGYENPKFSELVELFDERVDVVEQQMESTYKFDENGVVIAEVKKPIKNPFSVDQVPNLEVSDQPDSWPIFKNEVEENQVESVESLLPADVPSQTENSIGPKYIFDENGVVVGVEGTEETTEETTEPSGENYIFDENGVVVGVEGAEETTEETTEPGGENYIFDENGVVVGVEGAEEAKEETTEPSGENYIFDENGVVVGVEGAEDETTEETTEPSGENYIFDENGVVVGVEGAEETTEETTEPSGENYIFDENGMVVGVE